MRRPLLLAMTLLVALAAGWTAYWLYAQNRIRAEVLSWAEARRAEAYTIIWDRLEVDGYPFAFRVAAEQVQLADSRRGIAWQAAIPVLVAETGALDLRHWRMIGRAGITVRLEPGQGRRGAVAKAASFDGIVETGGEDMIIDLAARDLAVNAERPVAAARASLRLAIPDNAPQTHLDLLGRGDIALEDLLLPTRVGPLGRRVERASATLAIKGALPPGKLRDALASWRDDGGTVEVEALALDWDALSARAEGTLALDSALQPTAALSARVQGWSEILDALVAEGTMKQGDAVIARLALGLLAKPGPGGRSQITAPITIQNSTLFVAQVRIARLPRVTWE